MNLSTRRVAFTRRQVALLLLVIAFGAVLRVYRALTITLWSDELHTVRLVRLPVGQLITGQYAGDLNPPLYYVLLRLTLLVAGESEVAMRLFSVAFALTALVVLFFLVREMFPTLSADVALGSTAIMAFHPLYIFYATEIRSYTVLLFFTLLSLLGYYRLYRRRGRPILWAAVLLLSLAVCPYLHHFGTLSFIVVAAFAGIHLLYRRQSRLQLLVMALVLVAGLLYLPGALRFLFRQATVYVHASSLYPPSVFFQVFTHSLHDPPYEPLLLWLAILASIVGVALLLRNADTRVDGMAIAVTVTLVVAATLLIYARGINLLSRYLLHLAPLLFIAMAAPLALTRTHWSDRLLRALALAVILLYGVSALGLSRHTASETRLAAWKTDWELVGQEIGQMSSPAQPLVFTAWDNTPLGYYLDNPVLTVTEMQAELAGAPRPTYLIVVSENTGTLPPFPDGSETTVLYSNPRESVQILRLTPARD